MYRCGRYSAAYISRFYELARPRASVITPSIDSYNNPETDVVDIPIEKHKGVTKTLIRGGKVSAGMRRMEIALHEAGEDVYTPTFESSVSGGGHQAPYQARFLSIVSFPRSVESTYFVFYHNLHL